MAEKIYSIPTITQEKFAELAGVTLPTVRAWVQRGYLPTLKIGRRRLVDLSTYQNQVREKGK